MEIPVVNESETAVFVPNNVRAVIVPNSGSQVPEKNTNMNPSGNNLLAFPTPVQLFSNSANVAFDTCSVSIKATGPPAINTYQTSNTSLSNTGVSCSSALSLTQPITVTPDSQKFPVPSLQFTSKSSPYYHVKPNDCAVSNSVKPITTSISSVVYRPSLLPKPINPLTEAPKHVLPVAPSLRNTFPRPRYKVLRIRPSHNGQESPGIAGKKAKVNYKVDAQGRVIGYIDHAKTPTHLIRKPCVSLSTVCPTTSAALISHTAKIQEGTSIGQKVYDGIKSIKQQSDTVETFLSTSISPISQTGYPSFSSSANKLVSPAHSLPLTAIQKATQNASIGSIVMPVAKPTQCPENVLLVQMIIPITRQSSQQLSLPLNTTNCQSIPSGSVTTSFTSMTNRHEDKPTQNTPVSLTIEPGYVRSLPKGTPNRGFDTVSVSNVNSLTTFNTKDFLPLSEAVKKAYQSRLPCQEMATMSGLPTSLSIGEKQIDNFKLLNSVAPVFSTVSHTDTKMSVGQIPSPVLMTSLGPIRATSVRPIFRFPLTSPATRIPVTATRHCSSPRPNLLFSYQRPVNDANKVPLPKHSCGTFKPSYEDCVLRLASAAGLTPTTQMSPFMSNLGMSNNWSQSVSNIPVNTLCSNAVLKDNCTLPNTCTSPELKIMSTFSLSHNKPLSEFLFPSGAASEHSIKEDRKLEEPKILPQPSVSKVQSALSVSVTEVKDSETGMVINTPLPLKCIPNSGNIPNIVNMVESIPYYTISNKVNMTESEAANTIYLKMGKDIIKVINVGDVKESTQLSQTLGVDRMNKKTLNSLSGNTSDKINKSDITSQTKNIPNNKQIVVESPTKKINVHSTSSTGCSSTHISKKDEDRSVETELPTLIEMPNLQMQAKQATHTHISEEVKKALRLKGMNAKKHQQDDGTRAESQASDSTCMESSVNNVDMDPEEKKSQRLSDVKTRHSIDESCAWQRQMKNCKCCRVVIKKVALKTPYSRTTDWKKFISDKLSKRKRTTYLDKYLHKCKVKKELEEKITGNCGIIAMPTSELDVSTFKQDLPLESSVKNIPLDSKVNSSSQGHESDKVNSKISTIDQHKNKDSSRQQTSESINQITNSTNQELEEKITGNCGNIAMPTSELDVSLFKQDLPLESSVKYIPLDSKVNSSSQGHESDKVNSKISTIDQHENKDCSRQQTSKSINQITNSTNQLMAGVNKDVSMKFVTLNVQGKTLLVMVPTEDFEAVQGGFLDKIDNDKVVVLEFAGKSTPSNFDSGVICQQNVPLVPKINGNSFKSPQGQCNITQRSNNQTSVINNLNNGTAILETRSGHDAGTGAGLLTTYSNISNVPIKLEPREGGEFHGPAPTYNVRTESINDTVVVKQEPCDTVVSKSKPSDTVVVKQEPCDTVVVNQKPCDTVAVKQKPSDIVVIRQKPYYTGFDIPVMNPGEKGELKRLHSMDKSGQLWKKNKLDNPSELLCDEVLQTSSDSDSTLSASEDESKNEILKPFSTSTSAQSERIRRLKDRMKESLMAVETLKSKVTK